MDYPRVFLQRLFETAVASALPHTALVNALPAPPAGRTVVVGAGKAAAAMAHAVESAWPDRAALSGLVVTRYGHTPPRPPGVVQKIDIVEAAHPIPDAAGVAAAQGMLDRVAGLTDRDLVLCLLSGGGSSLLTLPGFGLTLADKRHITQALLMSGADIGEMNCVRKHLSLIKGGRLGAACWPARVVTLAISDVPGDDPSVIASGPTVADGTTCQDALRIIDRYQICLPADARAALECGQAETPKPGHPVFSNSAIDLIITPRRALEAAAHYARQAGVRAYLLSDEIEGESRDVAKVHASLAREAARHEVRGLAPGGAARVGVTPIGATPICAAAAGVPFQRPCVLLSGGETTVTVRPTQPGQPSGRGGRAGEFCLGLAQALKGQDNVWALAADTDGIDGSEDNAGAFVSPDTLIRAHGLGVSAAQHLARNDSYSFFEALDDLFITGPTHTNVNDFRALLIL